MDRLWAPWRMKFIRHLKHTGCIFCMKPQEKNDKQNYLLHRGKYGFIILNIYPYASGHLMVAPYRHIAQLENLNTAEVTELMKLTQLAIKVLKKTVHPSGFNIGANLGKDAGAGIADHLHLHIVPRWHGDISYMPILGNVRIMPELLNTTYTRLRKSLKKFTTTET